MPTMTGHGGSGMRRGGTSFSANCTGRIEPTSISWMRQQMGTATGSIMTASGLVLLPSSMSLGQSPPWPSGFLPNIWRSRARYPGLDIPDLERHSWDIGTRVRTISWGQRAFARDCRAQAPRSRRWRVGVPWSRGVPHLRREIQKQARCFQAIGNSLKSWSLGFIKRRFCLARRSPRKSCADGSAASSTEPCRRSLKVGLTQAA